MLIHIGACLKIGRIVLKKCEENVKKLGRFTSYIKELEKLEILLVQRENVERNVSGRTSSILAFFV